jgi:hypothetical protein
MFIIDTTDEAENHSTIAGLAAILADLLAIADHIGLPQPRYTTVSDTGSIGLQLPPETGSLDAVRLWASTYCAAMRSDTHAGDNGPQIWVSTEFDLDGVNVDVYAHIPVPETEPIISTEQDSEPETATPF